MKIISLNTWGGRVGKDKLLSFFEKYKEEVDVFCLQEIWSAPDEITKKYDAENPGNMFEGLQEISGLLENFVPYFRPHRGDNFGLLMLVKKGIEVKAEGEVYVTKYKGYVPDREKGGFASIIQFAEIVLENVPLTIINFHGIWTGTGKGDTEERIIQSNNIKKFIEDLESEVVLCGDFNLLPDTESIKILEDIGLKNLIKENNITSTRTSFYDRPVKFADYVFISPHIKVEEFKVLSDEVSDHSPLYLSIHKEESIY